MTTTYVLSAPLVIGSRLMPAAHIAMNTDTFGTISVEIDRYEEGPCAIMHYVIDTPGGTYEASDLQVRGLYADDTPGDIAARAVATLCSYLTAEAEAYTGSGSMGASEPDGGWMFSPEVAEWAYLNSDELYALRAGIRGDEN